MKLLSRRSFVQTLAAGSALAVLPRLAAQSAPARTAPSTGSDSTLKKGDDL